MDQEKPSRLPNVIRIGWGLGAVGLTIFLFTKSLILRFMTDYLGVAAVTAGFLLAISKVYDALTDPLMGMITDRTTSRWGRRRPYLVVGAVLCAATFVLLFTVPAIESDQLMVMYIGALLLLYATAYTVFNVSHISMAVEMTTSFQERSVLFSYRAGAIGFGNVLGGFLGPMIIAAYGGGRTGHEVMSWILAAFILFAMLSCFWMTRNATFRPAQKSIRYSVRDQLSSAATNRPFMVLLMAKMCLLMTASMNAGTTPYFTSRVLELSDRWLGVYFLCYGGLVALSQPLWLQATKRFGKRKTYIVAALVYAVITASWLLADTSESLVFFVLRALGIGFVLGGVLLASQSMLPDTMEYDYRRTGLTREGLFAGLYTTVEKLATALGVAFTGVVLGSLGYIATRGEDVVQPPSAITGIYLCFALIPAAFMALSCVFIAMYDLTEDKLANTGRLAAETS